MRNSMIGGSATSPSVRRPIRLVIRAPRRSKGGDDDDTSSLATMDPRAREWLLASAQGEYNPIAKLLQEEPRLAKRKDYITGYTGLHWAAKHGEMDLIKLLAGSYCVDVHAKSHGGYTALHLAAQQGHNDVYDLLVKAYQANENIRDYSGKKPRQYFPVKESSMSSDVYKSTYVTDDVYMHEPMFEQIHGLVKHNSFIREIRHTMSMRRVARHRTPLPENFDHSEKDYVYVKAGHSKHVSFN